MPGPALPKFWYQAPLPPPPPPQHSTWAIEPDPGFVQVPLEVKTWKLVGAPLPAPLATAVSTYAFVARWALAVGVTPLTVPVKFPVPATSSVAAGFVEPIPTLPFWSMRMRSVCVKVVFGTVWKIRFAPPAEEE